MPSDHPGNLRELDLEQHLSDPARRQSFVTPMFDLIAPRYDRFTRCFSFGMDRRWKESLVTAAARSITSGGVVCDVATGTGDLAFALSAARPDLTVSATDVSSQMLALAHNRRQSLASAVAVAAADIGTLPFPDGALDGVTAGYALRNTPDWRHSIAELARVIGTGGHLFTLDFFLPESEMWRAAFLAWLSAAGNVVGWLWHREPVAYGYIAHSIRHFTTARHFAMVLGTCGFDVVQQQTHLGGGIALHHAVRR
ncbi:MAG TPA: class I SAM-dependent methyltransferase [Gemmatimonadaceae bacterium]|nr:class I SAM-dependent methyltransferase [Gemmatimonadaceae bacterium]